jgi:hypothetical protein
MRLFTVLIAVMIALFPRLALGDDGWKLNGKQGIMNFVVIDRSQAKNQDIYRVAIAEICGIKPICQVLFWTTGTDAPKSLPMSDAQVASKVAHWQYNSNTGLRRLLWSCKAFPNTPKDECL